MYCAIPILSRDSDLRGEMIAKTKVSTNASYIVMTKSLSLNLKERECKAARV